MNNIFNGLGYGNYVLFILFALVIVISSYLISHIVDATEKRTKFSGVLIAGTLIAFISSIPEFTSSLVGIFTTHNPAVATGNLLGGNLFRTAMLGLTLIFFILAIRKVRTTIVQVSLVVSQILVFFAYFLIMWLAQHHFIGEWGTIIFTCLSVVVLFVYVFNLIIMIKKGKHQKEAIEKEVSDDDKQRRGIQLFFVNYFTKVRAWKMFLIFLASALAIVGASICIAISTNWILTCSWGWAENSAKTGFGYSLLLGIVTSIPEMITVITLLKLKNVNAAIGDILGSNMFSCLILSIIDLIYWHGDDTLFGPGNEEAQIISFWCFVSMLFFGCILLIDYWFRNRRHGKLFYGLNITALSLMFLTYVTYLVCAVVDPHIFDLTIHQSYATLLSSSVNDLCQNINCGRLHLS